MLFEPWCSSLAAELRVRLTRLGLLNAAPVAVQCTYFEKSNLRNWLVPMHQDLSIPVAERVAAADLRGWSEKEGVVFVQAPVAVLEQLVAVRLHLDQCSELDGALRVVPGSHERGLLSAQAAATWRKTVGEIACAAEQGAVLLMRPLLLHASSKSVGKGTRRVLHFLFGPRELPGGLKWRHAV